MAYISRRVNESVFQLKNFLGLNESPDGDVDIRMGESPLMRNFRITRERNLQVRSGYKQTHSFRTSETDETLPIAALWSGRVAGEDVLLCVYNQRLWRIYEDGTADRQEGSDIADTDHKMTGDKAFIFGYGDNAYILTGKEYYKWDGKQVSLVTGYVPLVSVATPPGGGGTLLEPVNRLTGKRRQRFSPDGTATVFHLAEKAVGAIDFVERIDGVDDNALPEWTEDTTAGTITFKTAPAAGTDCLVIQYDMVGTEEEFRKELTSMEFAEIYGGATDSRVFLYGGNSNKTYYSDIDENGLPSAEYFPELNVLTVGTSNTPVTGMIRHFSKMIVFKKNEAWSVSASSLTLAGNSQIAAFYLSPVQREIGNDAPGQMTLVENNPRTLSGGAVYEWKSVSGYIASADERTAKRLSQRVEQTLQTWDLSQCVVFDDHYNMEWYVFHNGCALVNNYENDTWYYYTDMPVTCMVRHGKNIYFGTPDGRIMHFDRAYKNNNGGEIDAYWESGAMDFERDWQRKYSSDMWVAIKPEMHAKVNVTMRSNRKSDYTERIVSSSFATLSNVDFGQWSFGTSREPQVKRVRIKVKKFTYSTLIFQTKSDNAVATVLGVDFKIRYTGNVKQR